ncbi:hypothetical protein BEH94_03995 [Candidatus Altiarchaeales archaeon WOR_SM1_SCG]|nr:hypothetical protein BEH94_03995 [Candidatus Altiarchaeales archaeon WOR_SM1_SCG]
MKNNTLIRLIVLILLLSISQGFVNASDPAKIYMDIWGDVAPIHPPPENLFLDKSIVIVNDEVDYLDIHANFTVINNNSETYNLSLVYFVEPYRLYSNTIEVYENGKHKKTIKDATSMYLFTWETVFKPNEIKNITILFKYKVGGGGCLCVDNNFPFFYRTPGTSFRYSLYLARTWDHPVSEEIIEIHLKKPIEGEPYFMTNCSEVIETESEKIIIWRWENYTSEPAETLYIYWEKKDYDVDLLKKFVFYAILSVVVSLVCFLFLLLIISVFLYGMLKKRKIGELLLIFMGALIIVLILSQTEIPESPFYWGVYGDLYGFESAGVDHFNWLTSFYSSHYYPRYIEFPYMLLLLSIIPSAYLGSRTKKWYLTLISIPITILISLFIYISFTDYSYSPLWSLLLLSFMMSVYLGVRRGDKRYHVGAILILFAAFFAMASGWQELSRYIFRETTVSLCGIYLIWVASRNLLLPEKIIGKRFLLILFSLIIVSILFDYSLGWGLLLLPVIVSVYASSNEKDKKYAIGVILILFAGFAAMISGWQGVYHYIFSDILVILCFFYLIRIALRNLLSQEEIIGKHFLLIWLSLIIISRLLDYQLGWQILSVIGLFYVCWILLKGFRNKKIKLEKSSSGLLKK